MRCCMSFLICSLTAGSFCAYGLPDGRGVELQHRFRFLPGEGVSVGLHHERLDLRPVERLPHDRRDLGLRFVADLLLLGIQRLSVRERLHEHRVIHLRGSTLYGLVGVHQLEKLLDRLLAGPRIPSEGRLQSERRDKGYKRDSDGLVSNRCGRGSWLAELRAAVRPDARGHDAHDERSR
jgi:hypothetical protein